MKKVLIILLMIYSADCQLISVFGNNYSNTKYSISENIGDISIKLSKTGKYYIGQGYLYHNELITTRLLDKYSEIIKVYPTPCSDILHIETNLKQYPFKVSLFDFNKNEINNYLITDEHKTLNISQLRNGTYFLAIKIKQKVKVMKILVIK